METVDHVADAAQALGITKKAAAKHLERAQAILRAATAPTLGVLGWLGARIRRGLALLTPPVAAALLFLLPLPHVLAPTTPLGPSQALPATDRQPVPPARAAASSSAPHMAHGRRAVPPLPGQRPEPGTRRTVAAYSTPVASGKLYTKTVPGSSDPVHIVIECVQELELTPGEHLGC
jgi:hypothetical protein